jgi:hypothetical protein
MGALEFEVNAQIAKWGMPERLAAIRIALDLLPHAQTPIGMGYKLSHQPTNCVRCRAEIALLELSTIVQTPGEVNENDT